MPSPYRLLFRRLGDRLDATLSPADAGEIGVSDLDRLKRQGLIRALPLDAVNRSKEGTYAYDSSPVDRQGG